MLQDLEPKSVFSLFRDICAIPRESGHEELICAYLQNFAKERGLKYATDPAGNVVIFKPATKGMELRPAVVLQSHMDMVCEKNEDVVHDFSKDPIDLYIEKGWLTARGTTLGADCGIGMAAQLALLDSNDVVHGPIECLFTASEETGLDGARALKPGFITGNILINLDSEDEGEIFIGCAGGIDTTARFAYTNVPVPDGVLSYKVSVSGGTGGHSGDEIHKGLANANQLLARFLWQAQQKFEFGISLIRGGNKRNAIAREAWAICTLSPKDQDEWTRLFQQFALEIRAEYRHTDPELKAELLPAQRPDSLIDADTCRRLVAALYGCPHGVMAMSKEITGLVETSTNLASVKMDKEGEIRIGTSQRSSVNSARYNAADRIESLFSLAGAVVTHESEYPGWAPNTNSPILKKAVDLYTHRFGTAPAVKAIHAGLECGIFLDAFPTLDMVSFGPTLRGVHAPGERLEIASVQKFWDFLLDILAHI
ncbi:MAG: aminoacyl-histidine dipeptidase [Bacteroidales bacterium]|nr:aminoacyl-histidine dipeptidase [Bacteroidales bacterium]